MTRAAVVLALCVFAGPGFAEESGSSALLAPQLRLGGADAGESDYALPDFTSRDARGAPFSSRDAGGSDYALPTFSARDAGAVSGDAAPVVDSVAASDVPYADASADAGANDAALAGSSADAGAAPTEAVAAQPAAENPNTFWYGWAIIPLDLAAATGVVYGAVKQDLRFVAGGAGLFLLGGPLIHLVFWEPKRAGISLLARLVVPPVMGFLIGSSCSEDCGDQFVWGFGAGVVIASVYDVLMANKGVPVEMGVSFTPSGTPVYGFSLRY